MSKKEEEEEVVFDLPEDVVVKILYRLPVKSLLRFTCVSKRWRLIISDSKFSRSAFEVASQTRTLRPRLLFSTYPHHSWDPGIELEPSLFESLGDSDIIGFEGNPLIRRLTPPQEVKTESVLASYNGLVVLGRRTSESYINLAVWNPTTGFFHKIPDPEFSFSLKHGPSFSPVTCAFGHVMAIDDYKLVFFVSMHRTVHIFSTRDGSWKVLLFPHSSFPCYHSFDGSLLVVSNEAIHWVSTGIPEAISAFDLVSEEFGQLPLPPALIESVLNEDNEPGVNGRRIWTQVFVGGRLCVRSQNEYWVMKQYGVPESWVKLCQFSTVDLPNVFSSLYCWAPAFVTEGGTVVMCHGLELVRIECHIEGKPVCCGRYKVWSHRYDISSGRKGNYTDDLTVYDETLLSL